MQGLPCDDSNVSAYVYMYMYGRLPWWLSGKESACNAGGQFQSLGWEDPLEKGMATHSSIVAWRIPWTV